MAGVPLPSDRIIDGKDLGSTLMAHESGPRNSILYYRGTQLYAARLGDYKAHFITQGAYGQFGQKEVHETPLLFNLSHDPSEKFDVAAQHPEVLEQINQLVEAHNAKLIRGKDQLAERK